MNMIAGVVLILLPSLMQAAPESDRSLAPVDDRALTNKRDGEAFLAANQAKLGVVTLGSGLQYRILKEGTGRRPNREDTVVCHFRALHIDGTEFASSSDANRPAVFPLKKLNKGLAEGLQLMTAGSKWQFVIPSDLAYGARGVKGHVGPNATVIFEIELVAVKHHERALTLESGRTKERTAGAPETLRISFKLDPRLTQGLYMGERWVSPARYNAAGSGQSLSVQAQALGVDARGRPKKIAATWTPEDTNVVTIASRQGNLATLTVHRPGASSVTVTGAGLSTVLHLKAAHVGKVLQVEISQAAPSDLVRGRRVPAAK